MSDTPDHGAQWLTNQIAHALRNPIFAGLIQTELLALRLGSRSEAAGALGMLRDQLHRLEVTVNDMLLFGRHASISPKDLRVTDLLQALATEYAQGKGDEPARLEVDIDPGADEVYWDPDAVRNILEPLIVNAIQHTDPPHQVSLVVRSKGDGRVTLAVRDKGAGIPDELHSMLILPFAPQHHGRPGLGLAIAHKFAVALGGALEVSSSVGEGTEVLVELPSRVADGAADSASRIGASTS